MAYEAAPSRPTAPGDAGEGARLILRRAPTSDSRYYTIERLIMIGFHAAARRYGSPPPPRRFRRLMMMSREMFPLSIILPMPITIPAYRENFVV